MALRNFNESWRRGAAMALLWLGGASCGHGAPAQTNRGFHDLLTHPSPVAQDRILILAPHPENETIGCAGLLKSALEVGALVRVVLMTNGDGEPNGAEEEGSREPASYVALGAAHQQESLTALASLGVRSRDVSFLGFPDRGSAALWTTHWPRNSSLHSPFTGAVRCPYALAVEPNVRYNGEEALRKLSPWLYLVHRHRWPQSPKLVGPDDLNPPSGLDGTERTSLPLSPSVQQQKRRAVTAYSTQMKLTGGYLLSFVRDNELFGRMPDLPLPTAPVPQEVTGLGMWGLAEPVTIDPPGDSERTGSPATDLRAIHLAYTSDSLLVRMDTGGQVDASTTYNIDFHGILRTRPFSPVKLLLRWRPGQTPMVRPIAGLGALEPAAVKTTAVADHIVAQIPTPWLPALSRLIVGARTARGGTEMDRVGRRAFRVGSER